MDRLMITVDDRRKELKSKMAKWRLETFKRMQEIEQIEIKGKFEEQFKSTLRDPLALLILWPCDVCDGIDSYIYCNGWEKYLEDGDLLDELYDTVEERLYDQYDDEFKVEQRMEKMTDKKAVKLLGKDYLDEEYPSCPYRGFCPEYGSM